jgi:YesN/AraC family two-component response regulator
MPESVPHILVVDDEACVQEALAAALRGAYVVHGASTGDEACAVLRRHPIAVIILDVRLRSESGLDLVRRFRALAQVRIVIHTAYGSEEVAVRALRAKVDEYLRKPVNLGHLRACLAQLIGNDGQPPHPVERARRLVEERPDQAHTTQSLAEEVGLSERHLRRCFLEAYAKTPRRYLTEVRMERAADLLRTTLLGVEQVAQILGYPSGIRFTRMFKRQFGLTPSEFRTKHHALGSNGGRFRAG